METISCFSLFIVGLSYGSTACMFSCMPFLTPLLVGNSNTLKQSVSVILPFSMGRIFSYTMIAVMAFGSAGFVKALLHDNALFQIILGIFTMFMGFVMAYRIFKNNNKSCSTNPSMQNNSTQSKFGLFGIGALMSINLCAPILTLIALSANSISFAHAIGMGISFGLGAVLIPFLFYGFFLSTVIRGLLIEFKSYTKIIEITASLLLIIVGILILNGHIRL